MFCKYCGAKINDNALFCFKCGKRTSVSPDNDGETYVEQNYHKTMKTVIVSAFVIIALIAAIIPIVNHHNNKVINTELGTLTNTNNYLVQSISFDDLDQITITFSNKLNWDKLENKNIRSYFHIMESGAVCDMDKKGVYSLAKGYSGSLASSEYSAVSKQECAKEFGDNGFYNLCVGTAVSDVLNHSITYEVSYNGEPFSFEEGRIYNFCVELDNINSGKWFYYDSYFRYMNGDFIKVKTNDLKPEDTYFAWKNNELHFARFSEYSNNTPPRPCFIVSDETYDIRD